MSKAVIRFIYVQGTGKRKHILLGNQGDNTLCGAWYFGQGTGKHNARIGLPSAEAKPCRNCQRIAAGR